MQGAHFKAPPHPMWYFRDLHRIRVCGVHANGTTLIWDPVLGNGYVSLWENALMPTLGEWFSLLNVRVKTMRSVATEVKTMSLHMETTRPYTIEVEVTSKSKVLRSTRPVPPAEPLPKEDLVEEEPREPAPHPLAHLIRWRCAFCGRCNYPPSYKCFKCNKERLELHGKAPKRISHGVGLKEETPNRFLCEMTEVLDSFVDTPVTPLVNLLSTKQPPNWKYLVRARVVKTLPADVRHFTRPFCSTCNDVLASVDGSCHDGRVTWRYAVQLILKSDDGPASVPVLVVGEGAELFFRSIPACDLWGHPAACDLLTKWVGLLQARQNWFAIQSYVPTGRNEQWFQIFGTVLVGE